MNYLMRIDPVKENAEGTLQATYVTIGYAVRTCTLTFTPNQKRYWATLNAGHRWRYVTHLINRKKR